MAELRFNLSIAVILLACLWFGLTAPAHSLDLAPADCSDFINEAPPRVQCGFVALPVDHDNKNRGQIRLPVLIAQSTRSLLSKSEHALLIPGAGGPGAAMGFGFQYYPGEFLAPYQSLLQAGFDLVILDQRGAGFASPRLSCGETIKTFKALMVRERTLDDEITQYHQAVSACHKRLRSHSLPLYDTRQSALDFLSVMHSLPYRWWGTIATSYATAIAQTMMQLEPDAFARAVLDSPVPIDFQKPFTLEGSLSAIKKSIKLCQTNNRCHTRYPQLAQQFDEIVSRAKSKPYRLTIKLPDATGRASKPTLVIDDVALVSILINALYIDTGIAALPNVIDKLHKRQIDALRQFATDYWYQSTDSLYADGLHLTVHCKERQQLEEQYIAGHPEFLRGLSDESRQSLESQKATCKLWQVKANNHRLPRKLFQTKTLVVAGSLDPVIDQDDIAHTTDNFSDSNTAVVDGATHSVWFQSQCVRDLVVDFFSAASPDVSNDCHQQLPAYK